MTTTQQVFCGSLIAALVAMPSLPLRAQAAGTTAPAQNLRLHPDNPRYFLFRGKPTVVITSGEHYGAVLNLDFDYRRYFDTLKADGLNGTRIFSGTYVETGGNFGIAANTLDPAKGRFISPWARSTTDGYADGGAKFDLTRFDEAYVTRLRDVLKEASARGIIVELVLFCPLYEDSMWAVSPMNPVNNVNGFPPIRRQDVLTLDKSGPLLAVQEAVARHLVAAVAGFDNVYIEICNEPYATQVPEDWQRHMTTVVADAVAKLPQPVLLSQNVSNQGKRVVDPHPAISIFNFHYATPPDTIAWNAHLRRLIGDNETGFRGTADLAYRTEGWDFILAGGGLYNNLDYSFTVGHEDGTFVFPSTQPGGGGVDAAAAAGRAAPVHRSLRSAEGAAGARTGGGRRAGRRLGAGARAGRGCRRPLPAAPAEPVLVLRAVDGRARAACERHVSDSRDVERWRAPDRRRPRAARGLDRPRHEDGHGVGRVGRQAWTADHRRVLLQRRRRRDAARMDPSRRRARGRAGRGVARRRRRQRAARALCAPTTFEASICGMPWFSRDEATIDHDFGTTGPRRDVPAATASSTLQVTLPPGTWAGSWIDPETGRTIDTLIRQHAGGVAPLTLPAWKDDLALDLRRVATP